MRERMDEEEFERLLELFPVVRPRDYHVDTHSSRQYSSRSGQSEEWHESRDAWDQTDKRAKGIDLHDAFWEKLKLAAEKNVGAAETEKFYRERVHQKVVYDELSTDAAWKFLNSSRC